MAHPTPRIETIHLRHADVRTYRALNDFRNRMRAERLPDDPPVPLAEAVQGWQNIPAFVDVFQWAVWDATHSSIVASSSAVLLRTDTNQHALEFDVDVVPERRRQGLGRALLAPIVEVAQREGRRLLIGGTTDRIGAGAAFMERLGAKRGIHAHMNQLAIANLDRTLIRQWQERAAGLASDFELKLWPGAYPEEQLEAVVQLHGVMNTMPRDDLDVEDFHITPAQLRQQEQYIAAAGTERWTLALEERSTGRLAGFTQVFWNQNRPRLLQQGDTGVFPEYRNRGLGRWLKAVMLEKILEEHPQVAFVRTSNADSNAAMLKINREMGFQPYFSQTVWQVETQQAAAYLDRASASEKP